MFSISSIFLYLKYPSFRFGLWTAYHNKQVAIAASSISITNSIQLCRLRLIVSLVNFVINFSVAFS